MMNKGSLFIVTGPSGVGKGTVLAALKNEIDRVFYSISATTRAPRPGETDGVNYYFLSHARFEEMIAKGELLEHAEYVGNYYGTPEGPVNEMLAQGMDVILEIEVKGALIVKEKRPDANMVFIAPPSFEELENRLRGRGTEKEEVIAERLAKAREDCSHIDAFDYVVVNDRLEGAVDNLASVIRASRCLRDHVGLKLV